MGLMNFSWHKPRLTRTLGLVSCVFFGVGSILGAGIYALIGKVAGQGGFMTWASFLMGALTALMTTFSYAELASMFPRAGGEYVYLNHALGRKWAAFVGTIVVGNSVVTGAAVALGFGGYLTKLIPMPYLWATWAIVVVLFMVNVWGIRLSSTVNILFTLVEISGLLLVIYAGFFHGRPQPFFALPQQGLNGLFLGAAMGFFAYVGFEEIVRLAEETKTPEKTIPRALFIASLIVALLYMAVSVAVTRLLPPDILSASAGPLADALGQWLGQSGVAAIAIIALFATTNTVLANMLGASRVLMSMGQQIKGLAPLSYISPVRHTPLLALVVITIVILALSLIRKIELVALIANLFICVTFILMNVSVIVLRFTHPNLGRPYAIPGRIGKVPIIPVIGLLLTAILLGYAAWGIALA